MPNLTVDESFFEPALRLARDYCRQRRDALELTDEQFLRFGIERVLGHCDSGREFLQTRQDRGEQLPRSTWFDALHSKRRGAVVTEVAARSYEVFTRYLAGRDWLGAFPELKDRAVWAIDGHQIAHASHARTDPKDDYVPVGELYGLCLHSGMLRSMATFQGDGIRRHEFPIFKEHLPRWVGPSRGKLMPIIVGDPAYIDILYWSEQRRLRQAVVITREKENMKPTVISRYAFDPNDPVNRGVEADEMAGYAYAYLRRIVYRDPASGERFVFVTTETSLRPGVIALLYGLRWKIEKAYDVFKNKLHQQKAWATGATAAHTQAHLIALTHNLLTILLYHLELAGIHEQKVDERAALQRANSAASQRVPAREMVRHGRQLTCQFIRLVRYCLEHRIAGSKPCLYSSADSPLISDKRPDTDGLPPKRGGRSKREANDRGTKAWLRYYERTGITVSAQVGCRMLEATYSLTSSYVPSISDFTKPSGRPLLDRPGNSS